MFLHIFHLAHGVGYLKMPSTVFEDALEAEEWAKNDQNFFLKPLYYRILYYILLYNTVSSTTI